MFFNQSLVWSFLPSLAASAVSLASAGYAKRQSGSHVPPFDNLERSTDLVWTKCYENFQCAMLSVPLDYHLPDGARAYVPLIKYPATQLPYKGMILTNPGGPGVSAIDFVLGSGPSIAKSVGENYDLVGWEPRGVGYSIPSANCTAGNPNSGAMKRIRKRYKQTHGPLYGDYYIESEYQRNYDIGQVCQEAIGGPTQAGRHMTTAIVARDIISILDAYARSPESKDVPDPDILNYLGYSYGTTIGITFASMFPDRMGRVVLDGVVDVEDYLSGLRLSRLQSTDQNFATFFIYCSIAGTECPYNPGGYTPGDLFLRWERTLDKLDVRSVDDQDWATATVLKHAVHTMKELIFRSLPDPRTGFNNTANVLLELEDVLNDPTAEKVETALAKYPINTGEETPDSQSLAAVSCTDSGNNLYNMTKEELKPYVKVMQHQSYIGGEALAENWLNCVGWSIQPVERFTGPFGGKTRNPILFVGNSWDHVTSVLNAHKAANSFVGSQVLTVNEPGHCVSNKCSQAKVLAYFQEGTMPGSDNLCLGLEENSGPWNTTLTMRMEENGAWRSILERMEGLRLNTWAGPLE